MTSNVVISDAESQSTVIVTEAASTADGIESIVIVEDGSSSATIIVQDSGTQGIPGPAVDLDELLNVNTSAKADGEALIWDVDTTSWATGTFEPEGSTATAIATHASAIDPHGDRAYALSLVDDLSGVSNPSTARTNLGLGSASTRSDSYFAIAASGTPVGGSSGQALVKNSGTDYDYSWSSIASAVTSVNGFTGAVVLTAADITGLGSAAFVSTSAFDAAGTASAAISTHSGAVDPHGDRAYALGLVDDLSGVSNASTARTNLGLGTSAVKSDTYFSIAAAGAPTGGSVGQVLTKNSGTDYDYSWSTVSSSVTSVNGYTGIVVLTASDITGFGSAALADTTDFDAAGTASTAIGAHAVASDPHGDRAYALGLVDDLSGVSNASTARTNLGLGSAAVQSDTYFAIAASGTPSGGTTGQVLKKNSNTSYDYSWSTDTAGTGDVVGPASAVDGNVVLFDTTTGKLIKDGGTLGTAAFTASTAYDPAGTAAGLVASYLPLAGGTLVGDLFGTSLSVTGGVSGLTLTSTVSTGTSPLTVTSTTAVTNLNADLLDGQHASAFETSGAASAAISAHLLATDPHGDRAYADGLVDDLSGVTDSSTARTNLGLGSAALQADTYFAIAASGAPTGGTIGQVLKKNSGTDYDYSWQADNTGSGSDVTKGFVIGMSVALG